MAAAGSGDFGLEFEAALEALLASGGIVNQGVIDFGDALETAEVKIHVVAVAGERQADEGNEEEQWKNKLHNKSILRLTVGALIVGGMMFTVWDWREWKIAETKDYGHGWAENREVAPAQKLEGVYTNKLLKFRLKYPSDWKVEGMTFSEPGGGVKMVVTVEEDARDLPTIADKMAEGVTQARGYINTDSASLVILTWGGPRETKQVAIAKKGDRVYKIEVTCESGAWKSWSATLEQIYRSVVLL